MIIYKITNKVNTKVYIGLTTRTLNQRWNGHKQSSKENDKPLYRAIRKYGIENFTIEEIDNTNDFIELGLLERHYIEYYNSQDSRYGYNLTAGGESNQLDANPRAKLNCDDVVQIREIYSMCELTCKECWQMFQNKISFSAFQKIWEGVTWTSIMPEVYTESNKKLHIQQSGNKGEKNSSAKYTEIEVLNARKYYVIHSLEDTYNKFGSKSASIDGFRSTLTRTYTNIPMYQKVKKQWIYKGKIIDIKNYKPVSTISESGE